ncbi:MAG: hypothetical protein CFE21_18890 [Bacteroidetes bacterium B1(2017)]|nr:MAG: hypothetical protein CFE21_18890 [Bacteroidetes bacterium B1(2017)]
MDITPQKSKLRFPLINMGLLRKNKHFFFLAMGLIMALIIGSIDYYTNDEFKNSFLGGVLVEAHGMLLDIILFGVLLTIYEKFSEKHNEIERLKEEIDDYRGWKEPEAMYRIVGCIKRLNKKGIKQINLNECFLEGANLVGMDLGGTNLHAANLKGANLEGANLTGANLMGANLTRTFLLEVNLSGAILFEANLTEANLTGANLTGANLQWGKLMGVHLFTTKINGAYFSGAQIDSLETLEIINRNSHCSHLEAYFDKIIGCYRIE